MAKYSLSWTTVTAVAVADATNMTDSGYYTFLLGGGAAQRLVVSEIYAGGEDAASLPTTMAVARDSQVASGTLGGNRNAAMDASATAPATLASFGNTSATNKPQRSATLHLLHLTFNTFGGIVRWVAAPGNEISVFGATASLGELSVSSITGAGKTSGHLIYEIV